MGMSVELQVAKKRQTSMYGLLQQIHNQAIKSTSSKACVRVIMYIVGRNQNLPKGGSERQANLVASQLARKQHTSSPQQPPQLVVGWTCQLLLLIHQVPCHHMLTRCGGCKQGWCGWDKSQTQPANVEIYQVISSQFIITFPHMYPK